MEFREFIHAPATVLLRGKDATLQLILPDDVPVIPQVELSYTVSGGEKPQNGKLRMLPVDGYRAGESYTVLAATVPGKAMQGETLQYSFLTEKGESTVFTVSLQDPVQPALVITETAFWATPFLCFELKNMTSSTIDLMDYHVIMRRADGLICRNALANREGENLIPAGELAAVNFSKTILTPEEIEAAKRKAFAKIGTRYPEVAADLADPALRYYFAVLGVPVARDGTPHTESKFVFERGQYGCELFLVPRDGGIDDAIYSVTQRHQSDHLDMRVNCASVWQHSIATPRVGHIVETMAAPTPGFADPRLTVSDYSEHTVPAILPVSPTSRTHLSGGDVAIRFAVIGGGTIGNATVYVREGDRMIAHTAYSNNEGLFEWVVPFSAVAYMADALYYYIEVQGGCYAARLGSEEKPLLTCLTDDRGPEILSYSPATYQVLENEHLPTVTVKYHDISGVNTRISVLCLDGLNVSAGADWRCDCVIYTPEKPLGLGTHTVEITLRDMHGNRTYHKYDFAIGDGKEMNIYCGQVHSHTAQSDAKGTPEEAYSYARNVVGLDYFAVTEHTHCYEKSSFEREIRLANEVNVPGEFAALYGFEMTWQDMNGLWGHTNVLNTEWACYDPFGTDLDAFNKMVARHPEGIAMFNHPGNTWGNNDEFRPFGGVLHDMYALLELNGPHHHPAYALALSKGWRVSPVFNDDTHNADWGSRGGMGYVLAPALTRENILDGMRRRRTYTTNDRTIKVRYRVNGEWLGAELQNPEKLDVEIELSTENDLGLGKLELLTEDQIVVAVVEAGPLTEFRWHVELPPDFDYYYLRITNGSLYTVTAPVFVRGRDYLNIKHMGYGVSEDAEHPHVVTATVKNEGDKTISDITVDFYLTDDSGFVLRQLAPFEEVHVGKLAPGESRTVSRRLPDVGGRHRVTAIVSGMAGKQRYADSSYVLLSPLSITKLMPLTADREVGGAVVKNPYAYVELYNHTAKPIALKGYSLGVWRGVSPKAIPDAERVLALDGVTIPPASTLTVWIKGANNPLTVADFNAHYGVNLLEGEDLIITDQFAFPTNNCAKKMDIRRGKEILARATFGYHCTHDTDIVADKVLCYAIAPQLSVSEKILKLKEGEAAPAPGKLLKEQIPRTLKGLCRKRESMEAEKSATRREVFTRLTKASLVPFRAAAFVANAVSAFKGFFDTKE